MTQPDDCETQWRAQEKAVAVAESITFAAYLKLLLTPPADRDLS